MRIRAIGLDNGDHFQTDADATVYVVVQDAWTHRRNKIVGRCEGDGHTCIVSPDDMVIWRDDLDTDALLRGLADDSADGVEYIEAEGWREARAQGLI